ncbi:MAG: RES family NAD+ phosphorylase [Terriglobia bacterium]
MRSVVGSNIGRKILVPILRALDVAGGLAITTRIGARLVGLIIPKSRPILCAACFTDHGLRMDADRLGIPHALPCPNCGAQGTKKLTLYLVRVLASQFFVRGSVRRFSYGSAPLVQFNEARFQRGDYVGPNWIQKDVALISEKGRIGLFHYGPHLWMFGEIEPLKALQDSLERDAIVDRILKEYPERILPQGEIIYRLRANPENPVARGEYDSPPDKVLGCGRLDSPGQPVLYCSQDIEGCVHECRVTVEDELYLASLKPTRNLKLLDLTVLLHEEHVTEFESLDLAVHMLFFAADHSYEITRAIAIAASKAGFDGLLYPSYFSQVRSGAMPFETAYGISVRQFPDAAKYATSTIFSNVALFGRPIKEGILAVTCIDRLVIHKVHYDFRFGPATPH